MGIRGIQGMDNRECIDRLVRKAYKRMVDKEVAAVADNNRVDKAVAMVAVVAAVAMVAMVAMVAADMAVLVEVVAVVAAVAVVVLAVVALV